MRKIRWWLHILLVILTCGLWLFPLVAILATTEMFNRGYREGKQAGRVARQNEIDEDRAQLKTIAYRVTRPITAQDCKLYPLGASDTAVQEHLRSER